MERPGRNEIREFNRILEKKESSRCYIEANRETLSKNYEGKEVIAITGEEGSEIAAAYDPESEHNWEQALSAIIETYGEETYHSAVAREL
ncbi:MAG: hypothetical protein ABEK16_02540 [Candidatus Nanohalobium sp.]